MSLRDENGVVVVVGCGGGRVRVCGGGVGVGIEGEDESGIIRRGGVVEGGSDKTISIYSVKRERKTLQTMSQNTARYGTIEQ